MLSTHRQHTYNKLIAISQEDLDYIKVLQVGTKKSMAGVLANIIKKHKNEGANQRTEGLTAQIRNSEANTKVDKA